MKKSFLAFVLIGLALSNLEASPAYSREHERRSIIIDTVAIFETHLGQGNFTGLPGAWCAWAVSAVLRATGHRPLANGMASSALAYGPHITNPKRGDLVVMQTRHGPAGHVGIVVAFAGNQIKIISGNWSHRVAYAWISRRSVTAFVRVNT
jgi:uncharacterized protein (TIGR02594 family)